MILKIRSSLEGWRIKKSREMHEELETLLRDGNFLCEESYIKVVGKRDGMHYGLNEEGEVSTEERNFERRVRKDGT